MVGSIKVINSESEKNPENAEVINVSGTSVLRNPFRAESEDEREISVRKFYCYLREKFAEKGEIYSELMKIAEKLKSGKDILLECGCHPMLCHGDVIASAVEGIIRNEQKKIKNHA